VPTASIIIRTKNEAMHLGRTLRQVFRQDYQDFDVILVDSGSTDGTLEIAERFPVQVLTIAPERFTYGYALNVGIAATRAPIVVSLSGHSIPYDSRWLGNLVRRFRDPEVAGTTSRQLCHELTPIYEQIFIYAAAGHPIRVPGLSDWIFTNASSAIRRDLWKQFPFDQGLPACEDVAWRLEAQARGYKIRYVPDSVVIHSHQESFARFMRRRILEGRGLAQVCTRRGQPLPAPFLDLLNRLEDWNRAHLLGEQLPTSTRRRSRSRTAA
jgi:rhamnosyltransferase